MQNPYLKTLLFLLTSSFLYFNANAQVLQCKQSVNFADLDINNVRARHYASGNMWFDPIHRNPHYEVPKGSGKHSMFSFDLWFGAVDEMGRRRMDLQRYSGSLSSPKYFPGPLNDIGDTFSDVCEHYDRVWKINKTTLDSFRQGLLNEIPKDILEWPARNNPHIAYSPEGDLAPFVDVNGDHNYNPINGDFPEILGDQTLWWVFNDKGAYGSPLASKTLQIDGQCMAYAYKDVPALQNHTFYKYTFTNKSQLRLDSVMVGMFIESDLGQFDDDYVGCDTLREMGIFYNGDAVDGSYGEDIPMVGVKLLQGTQKEDETYSGLYTCWFRGKNWTVWGLPENENSAFNGLWGLSGDGRAMTYGGNGQGSGQGNTTLYMYPSDPTDPEGWSECSEEHQPSDRHLVMGIGPTSMQNLEQKEFHFAVLWVKTGVEYPCPSFEPLQRAADLAQGLFDEGLITNIEENPTLINQTSKLHLFPNPITAHSHLFLEQNPNQTFQKGKMNLFDSLGRLVKSMELKDKHHNEWQVSELQSGVYFYRLQWQNGGMENGKLMVQ